MAKYIVLILIVVIGYFVIQSNKPQEKPVRLTNEDINNFFTGVATNNQNIAQDTIILYATSWCGYCTKARNLLKQSGARYKEYDIEKDSVAREQYQKIGGRGVPVIKANDKVIFGYNEQKLKQLVADKRYQL